MASITIRELDDRLKTRLQVRAARHGRSMEDEAREILKCTLAGETPQRLNLVEAIRRHIAPLADVELDIPPRQPVRPPSKLAPDRYGR